MGRRDGEGNCTCGAGFGYCLVHNGFNDSAFAYCDGCGTTAIFGGYSERIPKGVNADALSIQSTQQGSSNGMRLEPWQNGGGREVGPDYMPSLSTTESSM